MGMDLYHAPTLGLSIWEAFQEIAKEYGVRLEGIPDDANEYSDFWQAVGKRVLKDSGVRRPTKEGT